MDPPSAPADDGMVYDHHPVMFGDRPLLFMLLLALTPVVVGAPFLLAWYLGTRSNRLVIEDGRVRHRQGLLSKRVKEVAISRVRAVEVDQSFLQRLTDVGRVQLFTTGDVPEIVLGGLPRPYDVKRAVLGSDD